LTGNGEKGWFGWTTDPKLEELKAQFMAAASVEERKKLAEALQLQTYATGIFAKVGDFDYYSVVRKGVVTGLVPSPINAFWNLKKN
jgi:peptide/nickel transport system substrate-binding protein